jgi:hypothetical protein
MRLPSRRPETTSATAVLEPAPQAPLLVRALRGEATHRPPVWLMRQAGRCLPGYQRLRSQVTFLELCRAQGLRAEDAEVRASADVPVITTSGVVAARLTAK